MRVNVGPAKREGKVTTIFDDSLQSAEVSVVGEEEVRICFRAGGMYDQKSAYQYTLNFSRSELSALFGAS